nr:hypothetical protein [Tanacetum cinerariifolium]
MMAITYLMVVMLAEALTHLQCIMVVAWVAVVIWVVEALDPTIETFMLWTIVVNRSVPMVSVLLLLFRDEDRVYDCGRRVIIVKCNNFRFWERAFCVLDLILLKGEKLLASTDLDLVVEMRNGYVVAVGSLCRDLDDLRVVWKL